MCEVLVFVLGKVKVVFYIGSYVDFFNKVYNKVEGDKVLWNSIVIFCRCF